MWRVEHELHDSQPRAVYQPRAFGVGAGRAFSAPPAMTVVGTGQPWCLACSNREGRGARVRRN